MKLVFVSRRCPPYNGGAERQIHAVARGLASRGHDVTVLSGNHRPGELRAMESDGTFTLLRLPDPQVRFVGTASFLIRLKSRLQTLLSSADALIASQINETSMVALNTARSRNVATLLRPSSGGVNGGNLTWARSRRFGTAYIKAASGADRLIMQTSFFSDDARTLGFDESSIDEITNLVEQKFFNITDPGHPHRWLWSGRFHPVKNPQLALETFKRCPSKRVRLLMRGKGPLLDNCRETVGNNVDLKDRVVLPGMADDILPDLARSQNILMTSDAEALPNALIEAMAAGRVIVATDCDGVSKLIDHDQNGLIAPRGCADDLSKLIQRVDNDPGLASRLRQAARDTAHRHHPDVVLPRWERAIEHACRKAT